MIATAARRIIGWSGLFLAFIPAIAFAANMPVTFDSAGVRLVGEIAMPATKPITGVVLIHGSGPDGAADYAAQAKLFADHGVAALTYDKRGWNRSGGDWHRRPAALLGDDAIAAAAELRRSLQIPVGYWGISQGGWVLANVGARDHEAAFLIGVAATGVDPTGQELWHKDKMMAAAGAPGWARIVSNRFWRMTFDFMDRVSRGQIALPPSILVNERAGSSFGLRYDPLSDWSRSTAPLLLLYGERDELEPWHDSGARISAARLAGGASRPMIIAFPAASHAITTRSTGLAFDWGKDFHPAYAPIMASFIARPARAAGSRSGSAGRPDARLDQHSEFAAANWWRSVWVQLPLLIILPILQLAMLRSWRRQNLLDRITAGLGFACWASVVALLILFVFPAGSFYDSATRFPPWGWIVPPLALATAVAVSAQLARMVRRRPSVITLMSALMLVAFLGSWFLPIPR